MIIGVDVITALQAEKERRRLLRQQKALVANSDIVDWAQKYFYIPETGEPIILMPHQIAVLRFIFQRNSEGRFRFQTVLWSQPKKSGKALSEDTLIPTEDGWLRLGDLQVGDKVFDEFGNICSVTYVTESMLNHKCFEVKFSDGSIIVADADHLWLVDSLRGEYGKNLLTTQQIKEHLSSRADRARNFRIKVADPLKLPDKKLIVDPYVLGAWLGDGASANGSITCCEKEILDRISLTEKVTPIKVKNRAASYHLGSGLKGKTGIKNNSLTARLRYLNVIKNKHIPITYLRASYNQRLALLQGLMDTDGYISKPRGTSGCECEISTKFEQLSINIRELLVTLGIKSTVRKDLSKLYGKICGYRYRIKFHADKTMPVFSLNRKYARQRFKKGRTLRSTNRHIIAVDETPSVPVKCIQVDSYSHLYLAGDMMIPTHNTRISAGVGRWVAETWGKFGEILCCGNDAEQAKERSFGAIKQSIELDPQYNRKHQELPDRWRLRDMEAVCLANGTTVKAVATDYKGEAGSNPMLTIFTELWGFTDNAALKFWAEMAPSPTRLNSMRWVETYAGYDGESELLENLYDSVVKQGKDYPGRQITAGELGSLTAFQEAPNPDSKVPVYVNESARMIAYWDTGEVARRMLWQQGAKGREYYASEQATQTPNQFRRLHLNEWVSAESEFIDISQWDRLNNPMPLKPGDRIPCVIGVDAAVSGDTFGIQVVTRHPDPKLHDTHVVLRYSKVWKASAGQKINFEVIEQYLVDVCKAINVACIAYDPYQLHQMMSGLKQRQIAWCKPFDQGTDRLIADKLLFDVITQGRICHDGNADTREHMQNANKKQAKNEDTKIRIIKKSESRKIDLVVALSMAVSECMRLNI